MSINKNTEIPELYIVGFQKCGSSSLFNLIESHPQIIGTSPKETYCLVDDDHELYNAESNILSNPNSMEAFLPNSKIVNEDILVLEGSVCNFSQKRALEYITALNDSRVIFIIRDPIDRFLSTYFYNQAYLLKKFGNITIEQYFNLVKNKSIGLFMSDNALDHGHYSNYIEKWESRMGKGRVFVTSLNEMKDNLTTLSEKIAEFIGVDNKFTATIPHKNQSEVAKYKSMHKFILKTFGGLNFPFKSKLINIYRIFMQVKPDSNIQIDVGLKDELMNLYRKEYEIFSEKF